MDEPNEDNFHYNLSAAPKRGEERRGDEVGLQNDSSHGSFSERSVGNGTGTNQN